MIVNIQKDEQAILDSICEYVEPILPSIYRQQISDFRNLMKNGYVDYDLLNNVLSIIVSVKERYESKNYDIMVEDYIKTEKIKNRLKKMNRMIIIIQHLLEQITMQNAAYENTRR